MSDNENVENHLPHTDTSDNQQIIDQTSENFESTFPQQPESTDANDSLIRTDNDTHVDQLYDNVVENATANIDDSFLDQPIPRRVPTEEDKRRTAELFESESSDSDDAEQDKEIAALLQSTTQRQEPPRPTIPARPAVAPGPSSIPDSPRKSLAEKLRQKREALRQPKQPEVLANPDPPDNSSSTIKVIATNQQRRDYLRKMLISKHARDVHDELHDQNDIMDETMVEEEDEEEENEEEEKKEEQLNELETAVVEELTKDEDDKKELTDEEIEKILTQRIIEMRFTEDLEEIKKIIRIITGQWRSGKLRRDGKEDTLQKAMEGDASEKKQLNANRTKKRERDQRRMKEREEQTRTLLTTGSLNDIIERAMWVREGEAEGAKESDIIRSELAMRRENDPRREILERLEMKAFIREQEQQNAAREARNPKVVKTSQQITPSKAVEKFELDLKASDLSKRKRNFSFTINDADSERNWDQEKPQDDDSSSESDEEIDNPDTDLVDFLR